MIFNIYLILNTLISPRWPRPSALWAYLVDPTPHLWSHLSICELPTWPRPSALAPPIYLEITPLKLWNLNNHMSTITVLFLFYANEMLITGKTQWSVLRSCSQSVSDSLFCHVFVFLSVDRKVWWNILYFTQTHGHCSWTGRREKVCVLFFLMKLIFFLTPDFLIISVQNYSDDADIKCE